MSKVVVIGAGINGVTSAIELKTRGHNVVLVDPGPLPHPLAASTDISKAVRAAYGADDFYARLAERSIELWRKWNEEFGVELYHETGALFLRRRRIEAGDFEYESLKVLERYGHNPERVDSAEFRKRFPALNWKYFQDGFFDPRAGYAESGCVVATLVERAKSLGVELIEGAWFSQLDEGDHRVKGVLVDVLSRNDVIPSGAQRIREIPRRQRKVARRGPSTALGMTRIAGDVVVMATGAWTPYLLPFTKKFFRATGHPVFHFKPTEPRLFSPEHFPFFGADITATGYYGFPLNADGVVKIANHGPGREMSPDSPERAVTAEDEKNVRAFLSWAVPALTDAPIVHTRVCLYCDTNDGDFWIARDPDRPEMIIAAGDNGHGFKFAPVLGEIIADAVEEKSNPALEKFRWRPEVKAGVAKEAARFKPELL